MYSPDAARQYIGAAQDAEGNSAANFVTNLEERRERLQKMANTTAAQAKGVMNGSPDPRAEQLQQDAHQLDQAVTDVQSATDGHTITIRSLEGDAAGCAHLEKKGTEELDPTKSMGNASLVDRNFMEGIPDHEEEHTRQAHQDVSAVTFTGNGFEVIDVPQDTDNPDVLTEKKFLEVGAMAMQKKKAPKSFEGLHGDYQRWFREVMAHGSPDRVQQLARQSDGLRTFAAEVTGHTTLSHS